MTNKSQKCPKIWIKNNIKIVFVDPKNYKIQVQTFHIDLKYTEKKKFETP